MTSESGFEILRLDEVCVEAKVAKKRPEFLVAIIVKCQKIRFANVKKYLWTINKLQSDYSFKYRAVISHGNYSIMCSGEGIVTGLPKESDVIYGDAIKLVMQTSIDKVTNDGTDLILNHDGPNHESVTNIPAEIFESRNDMGLTIKKIAGESFEGYGFAEFFEYCMMN